jgi:DNA-binding MarR family transcriptional regulator
MIVSAQPSSQRTPARPLAESLRLAVTRLARRLRREAGAGLSPSMLAALSTVERRGPLTLGELAAAEGIAPPSVTAAVARLEEAGLVERATLEEDRRVSVVSVTAAGTGLLRESRRAKEAYLARRLAAMRPEDRAVLARAAELLEEMLEGEGR